MKRTIAIVLTIALLFGTLAVYASEKMMYELWTESPYVTSGINYEELNVYRAKSLNELELYPLSRIGSNYYFAVCEEKWTDGGYNGNSKTSVLHAYIILVNGGDFIILSSKRLGQEYLWDRSILINNLSDKVTNTAWYISKGSEVPYYVIQPKDLYTNYYYTKYLEQIIITSGGKMYSFSTDMDYGCQEYPVAYNNILYMRVDRYRSGSSYYYYYTDSTNSIRAARMTPYIFSNGAVNYDTNSRIHPALSGITTANGYTVYVDSFASNVPGISPDFINQKGSSFPDGRRVEVYWSGMGNYLYEVWYRIYNADGTLRANGPTGYSAMFSSVFNTLALNTIAINNSKFAVYVNKIGHSFLKEYYRVAVVEETISGEIQTGGSIGNKNITPPDTTDTEPIQNVIDFTQNDLPLGFNIRNNVIDSGKLDTELRQQVNAIRLNDIVILKKSGYISGSQNTGVSLSTYSSYDYGMGSNYIRFYSNGQNFLWYCYYPESLTVGTYNKTFYIGDKTVYATIKVIAPPNNNGVTIVTF